MRKRVPAVLMLPVFLSLLLLMAASSFCQVRLQGTVISETDKKPVSGASVYINNTTIGVVTDSKGRFELTAPNGLAELVVSHVSYDKVKMPIENSAASKTISVVLKPKTELLDNVSIRLKYKETWKKWGSLFTDYLVGEVGFAKNCTILNPEVVRFRWDKSTQTVIAKAKTPLLVENKALGYLVHYDLDSFAYCFSTNLILRKGTNFNEPLPGGDKETARELAINRLFAYQGSLMHFMRTVFNDTWTEEGFTVYQFTSAPNIERQRVLQVVNKLKATNYEKEISARANESLANLVQSKDTQSYYIEILKGPDYFFRDSLPADFSGRIFDGNSADIKTIDFSRDTFLVRFDDPLDSLFKKDVKSWRYYQTLSRRFDFTYSFFPPSVRVHNKFSILFLDGCCGLNIAPNGSLQSLDAPLFSDGFMGWKKIAYQLPLDYYPELDKQLIRTE